MLTTLPPSIVITFDDALLPTSSVALVDGSGMTVTSGSVDPADPHALLASMSSLPNGTFEVRWTAATDDGHIERGTFTFTVALATPPPATEAPATPVASPAASEPARATPTALEASSPASAAPTAAPAGSSGDAATLGDVVIPIVAGLAIVGAGLAWFLRRRRAA